MLPTPCQKFCMWGYLSPQLTKATVTHIVPLSCASGCFPFDPFFSPMLLPFRTSLPKLLCAFFFVSPVFFFPRVLLPPPRFFKHNPQPRKPPKSFFFFHSVFWHPTFPFFLLFNCPPPLLIFFPPRFPPSPTQIDPCEPRTVRSFFLAGPFFPLPPPPFFSSFFQFPCLNVPFGLTEIHPPFGCRPFSTDNIFTVWTLVIIPFPSYRCLFFSSSQPPYSILPLRNNMGHPVPPFRDFLSFSPPLFLPLIVFFPFHL